MGFIGKDGRNIGCKPLRLYTQGTCEYQNCSCGARGYETASSVGGRKVAILHSGIMLCKDTNASTFGSVSLGGQIERRNKERTRKGADGESELRQNISR